MKIIRAANHHEVMAVIGKPKPTRQAKPKPGKPKEKKLNPDYWFSLCIRERDNWTCTYCGKYYEPTVSEYTGLPGNPGLHCSHFVGRANYSTRFEPLNCDAHCYGCHAKMEGNPHVFTQWKLARVGQDIYDIIIEKSMNIMLGKQNRQEKQEIAKHFQAEYHRLVAEKEKGNDVTIIGYR